VTQAKPEAFDPKAFKRKRAGVIGLGKSGLAAAKLLASKGFAVFGSDTRPRADVRAALGRLPSKIAWEAGGHSDRLLKCGFVVKSPGLPPHLPVFEKLRKAGIPVFSELDVALAFTKAKEVVAVTGTNGKTTTTALTGAVFAAALPRGRKALVCGNIGVAISEMAPKAGAKDVIVVEASSYQLEDSRHFAPQAAAILNITADHIDHHGSMQAYIEAKARVFADQKPGDACVFNAGDPLTYQLARRCSSRKLFFGPKSGHVHAWIEDGKIAAKLPGQKKEIKLVPPKLPGAHNLENAMAATLLALARGLKPAGIQKAFKSFKGVEHRLEEVGTFKGLRCINDSKATNVDSTLVALRAMGDDSQPIFLILGGLHKGSPYGPLRSLIERRVKGILTIGSAARKIEEDLGGTVPIFPCGDLKTAVDTAFKVATKGEILLLSPACASFDQFKNFEDRGEQFKDFVRKAA
jgi:UDP-N-acetylmuramoylalanine--D-glutamate ligase